MDDKKLLNFDGRCRFYNHYELSLRIINEISDKRE